MKLETDARVHAQAYIHKHNPLAPEPCPVACALIRNLLEDLFAANAEIRSLNREKSASQLRITELYGLLVALKEKEREHEQGSKQQHSQR